MQTLLSAIGAACRSLLLSSRVPQGSGVCESSYASPQSVLLEHQGCWSTRAFRPRFCALACPDRCCCSPSHTGTAPVVFRCPRGRLILRQVMVIESCSCSPASCRTPPLTSPPSSARYWGAFAAAVTGRSCLKEMVQIYIALQNQPAVESCVHMWSCSYASTIWKHDMFCIQIWK